MYQDDKIFEVKIIGNLFTIVTCYFFRSQRIYYIYGIIIYESFSKE